MKKHVAQISESTAAALRELIGRNIVTIYTPCIQAAGAHFACPSVSIPLSDCLGETWRHRYVNIRAHWSETPQILNDYWELQASVDSRAEGIEYSGSALVAPCSISFYGAAPAERIEVYSFDSSAGKIEADEEDVLYDNALRFMRTDGSAFCIACQLNGPGIATDVHLSGEAKAVEEFLDGSVLRLTLTR